VNFGRTYSNAQYSPWAQFYIDYDQLKRELNLKLKKYEHIMLRDTRKHRSFLNVSPALSFSELRKSPSWRSTTSQSSLMQIGDNVEGIEAFRNLLDNELEKCILFFIREQGKISSKLVSANEQNGLDSLTAIYHSIGEQILLLVKFSDINLTALKKILKKHDKKFRNEPLSDKYHTGLVEPLQDLSGIFALILVLRRKMLEAADLETNNWELERCGHVRAASRQTLEELPFLNSSLIEYDPVLAKLERIRTNLRTASAYTQNLAAMSLFYIQEPESDVASDLEDLAMPPVSEASRLLNLLSAFLYMTNYYIVAPTSGIYATRLGGSEADSAMIIGMTPLAAQVGSILYSWWANKGYKNPLIFASCCMTAGNLLYSLALPCKSMNMVLFGRLLNGFGAARAINRRYIADAFRKDERTAASAMFVTFSSLGMAAGPFVSAFLGLFLSQNGRLLTIETAPGWIMAFAWGLYLVSIVLWFQDPCSNKLVHKHEIAKERKTSSVSGEKKHLLVSSNDEEINDISTSISTLVPVMLTLLAYFVLKLALECLLSSTSMLASYYFNWHKSIIGIYLTFLGLLMFPTSLLVARYSRLYDDRELVVFFLSTTVIGLLGIAHYFGERYTEGQYIIAAIIIFCSTNSLEGCLMALLSKTIPKSWAKHSILNSGLLATEAGTLGRTFGAFFLTWCAKKYGVDHLLNYAFVPVGVSVFLTLMLTLYNFDFLSPLDDDDDE